MNHRRETLREWLEAERATMQALWESLDAEYKALGSDDVERLEAVTRRKNSALADSRQQRLAWAEGLDLPRDASVSEIVDRLAGGGELRELASELIRLVKRCQDANRRNGLLISRLQDRTRGALQILRGDTPGSDVYSLSGAREHHVDGKSLGKA